jgi:NAD(P)-dependent dehydrogenase (short-subunit alcohol dehydrogenase family)
MTGILITGAAKRIGAHLARGMARDGMHVVAHYGASRIEAEALAAAVQSAGGTITLVQEDLAVAGAGERLIETAFAACPGLAIVVNCASRFVYDDAATATTESLGENFRVNAAAPIEIAQAFAKRLPADRTGLIVNMLDAKLVAPNPDYFSYSVAKYALLGATKMMALQFAPRVRVAGIAPGITLPSGKQSDGDYEAARVKTPLGLNCTPDEIAAALRFIIGAPAYTGCVIVIDAGEMLAPKGRDVAFLGEITWRPSRTIRCTCRAMSSRCGSASTISRSA